MTYKKILIAEDREDIRKNLEDLLREYEIDFVKNEDEEIERARSNQYDLIITDNQMNRINAGIYAIKEIRTFNKEIPIIMYSADKGFDVIVEALASGANLYVSKGNDNKLKEEIEIQLKGGRE